MYRGAISRISRPYLVHIPPFRAQTLAASRFSSISRPVPTNSPSIPRILASHYSTSANEAANDAEVKEPEVKEILQDSRGTSSLEAQSPNTSKLVQENGDEAKDTEANDGSHVSQETPSLEHQPSDTPEIVQIGDIEMKVTEDKDIAQPSPATPSSENQSSGTSEVVQEKDTEVKVTEVEDILHVPQETASVQDQSSNTPELAQENSIKKDAQIEPSSSVDISSLLLEDLPPLPGKPKYPCPHLSDEEVMTYLAPLYLRGWGVVRKKTAVHGSTKRPLFLTKKFSFQSFDHLMLFVNDMVQIIQKEQHEPAFNISGNRLKFLTHTHSATIPGVTDPNPKSPKHIFPGITLRDVRLAYLVEGLEVKHLKSGSAVLTHEVKFAGYRPSSLLPLCGYRQEEPKKQDGDWDVQDLLSDVDEAFYDVPTKRTRKGDYLRTRQSPAVPKREPRCPACNGNHNLKKCPDRQKIKPVGKCHTCGGDHWIVDCPDRKPYWVAGSGSS